LALLGFQKFEWDFPSQHRSESRPWAGRMPPAVLETLDSKLCSLGAWATQPTDGAHRPQLGDTALHAASTQGESTCLSGTAEQVFDCPSWQIYGRLHALWRSRSGFSMNRHPWVVVTEVGPRPRPLSFESPPADRLRKLLGTMGLRFRYMSDGSGLHSIGTARPVQAPEETDPHPWAPGDRTPRPCDTWRAANGGGGLTKILHRMCGQGCSAPSRQVAGPSWIARRSACNEDAGVARPRGGPVLHPAPWEIGSQLRTVPLVGAAPARKVRRRHRTDQRLAATDRPVGASGTGGAKLGRDGDMTTRGYHLLWSPSPTCPIRPGAVAALLFS